MRLTLPFTLVLAIACSGGIATPEPTKEPVEQVKVEAPPTTQEAPKAPVVDPQAGLGDHWLVILASKKDAAEATPALDALAAKGDVGAHPGTLNSSRFKNLMPCYTVAYAEATKDKKSALDLSKKLKELGVDNYVKNTGAFVGRSALLDAYCSTPEDTGGGDVKVAAFLGGSLWIPVAAPDNVVEAAIAGAPAPVPLGDGIDNWIQPTTNPPAAVSGARYRAVDARTGRSYGCSAGRVAGLTLGVAHFGYSQAEEPPRAPTCGDVALYAELQCAGDVTDGSWVVVPEDTKVDVYTASGVDASLEEQAKVALTAASDWDANPDESGYEGLETVRTVTVTRWKGSTGDVALVHGTREIGGGMCGGDSVSWVGLFVLNGTSLGAPMGGFLQTGPGDAVGVLDVGGDGHPEFVFEDFPSTTNVYEANSVRGSLEIAYCDCPC